jgi:hypothetical protein
MLELKQFKSKHFFLKPKLVTKQTSLGKPKSPVIDAPIHLLPTFGFGWEKKLACLIIDGLVATGFVHYNYQDIGWN